MHFVTFVKADAQDMFCADLEVACQGVGLVVEGIAGLDMYSQLVLSGGNFYFL